MRVCIHAPRILTATFVRGLWDLICAHSAWSQNNLFWPLCYAESCFNKQFYSNLWTYQCSLLARYFNRLRSCWCTCPSSSEMRKILDSIYVVTLADGCRHVYCYMYLLQCQVIWSICACASWCNHRPLNYQSSHSSATVLSVTGQQILILTCG